MLELGSCVCARCNQQYPLSSLEWHCSCAGLFELDNWPAFDPARIDADQHRQWRYRQLLPLDLSWEEIKDTRNELAQRGFYVEDTSGVAVAALAQLLRKAAGKGDADQTVVLLTGHGPNLGPGQ